MSLGYDLSSIFCPKCQKNNIDLEIMRFHIFTPQMDDKTTFYDIKCHNCDEVFPIDIAFCLRDML